MGIGRKIDREIGLQVPAMQPERTQNPAPEGGGPLPACQMVDPDPGKRPESDFESARPVDPPPERVLLQPACELGLDLREIRRFSRQAEGLRQDDQVLVPVQLPNY